MWSYFGLRTLKNSSSYLEHAVATNHHCRHTSYLRGMVDCKYRCYVRMGQERSLWNAILLASQLASFASTGCDFKAPVLDIGQTS